MTTQQTTVAPHWQALLLDHVRKHADLDAGQFCIVVLTRDADRSGSAMILPSRYKTQRTAWQQAHRHATRDDYSNYYVVGRLGVALALYADHSVVLQVRQLAYPS